MELELFFRVLLSSPLKDVASTSELEVLRDTRGRLNGDGGDVTGVEGTEGGKRGDLRQAAEELVVDADSKPKPVGVTLREVSREANESSLSRVGNEPRYRNSRDSISVANSASILYNNSCTLKLIIPITRHPMPMMMTTKTTIKRAEPRFFLFLLDQIFHRVPW